MAWPNLSEMMCCVALLISICVAVDGSRWKLTDSKSLSRHSKKSELSTSTPTTTAPTPFKFQFIIDQVTTPKPKRFHPRRRRCCRIGKIAARLGYTCYVKRNIALIRVNMPMRQRMKFMVKGVKWGYPFAREMEFCAKTSKYARKFNRCCHKETREIDSQLIRS